MKHQDRRKWALMVILIVILILALLVIRNFIVTLLTSIILAFLFHPIYRWLANKTRSPKLSSVIITTTIVLLIIIPSILIINVASREALIGYTVLKQKVAQIDFDCDQQESQICNLLTSFGDVSTQFYIQSAIERASEYIVTKASNFALAIPTLIINFFLMIFVMYYLFTNGENSIEQVKSLLPYSKRRQDHIMHQIYSLSYAIVYGTFLIALIQGIIAWVAFTIVDAQGALIWSLIIFILAFIPAIGATIIWIPASAMYFLNNNPSAGIIILIAGLIMSAFDNFVRPKIIGKHANAHPVLILLGILGGITLFGFVGVVIGPLILSLSLYLVKAFAETDDT